MSIQINDEWRVTGDKTGVTLERRVVVDKGDNAGAVRWVFDGYYANVNQAIAGCANKRVNVALDSEFWQVAKLQREILSEIAALEAKA